MNRRAFVTGLGAVLAVPLTAGAEQPGEVPRVALVMNTPPTAAMAGADPSFRGARAFVHGLRDLGYVDGRNIMLERRSAEGQLDRIPGLVQELVRLRVNVLVISGDLGTRAARQATGTIPIVGVSLVDPVASGLAATLGRPGGNVTGVGSLPDLRIGGKILEVLKDTVPTTSRVTLIRSSVPPGDRKWSEIWSETEAAARALKLTLTTVVVDRAEDYEKAFAAITRDRPDALFVSGDSLNLPHRKQIIDFAARRKLPGISYWLEFAESGGLMAYGADLTEPWRRAASYVDKILKGAKPGDLPIEQQTKHVLAINLRTAKALGLTIPPSVLARAEEVIQ